jgi:dipeptidyl aminopeptidase/acylaminoacyl peptidase
MSSTARAGMHPEDIGSMRQVEDPRVSPDGAAVAFTVADVDLRENRYRRRIFVAPVDGSARPRPFSAGPSDQLARWSPDGRSLAVAANNPDGASEICVIPVHSGGERVVVASWPSRLSELAWSPDSSQLAFVARDPDPDRYGAPGEERKAKDMPPRRVTHLFFRLDTQGWTVDRPNHVMVVPADGSRAPIVLTPGAYQANGITWSPEGDRIAFASARHDTWDLDGEVDLWTVAAGGSSEPHRLTKSVGAVAAPAWSPDGGRIAFVRDPTPRDEPRHERLCVIDVASGDTVELAAELDRNCGPFGYSRTPVWAGEQLLFSVEDEGNLHVYSVPASGDGKAEALVEGDRWVTGWDFASGTLAFAVSSPTTFPELVVKPGGQDQERQLTDVTSRFAASVALARPEPFVAVSADGTEVPCWAMAPIGAVDGTRYPTLLNVHGGPFTSYGNRFFDEFQIQAGAGFGVVYCNPRGSSGYSEAWGRAVRWPECDTDPGSGWGGVDFEDVMACVEEACRKYPWVDPDRLGILGGSYGGYMTSWAIGHTDRFKAACSERACNNLLSLEHNSDIAGVFRGYVGRNHLEAREAFLRQSPITYVENMTTPVLMLHSEEDLRCPINQAEELFIALRLLGRNPVLVRFPGESHELSRSGAPRHRVQRAQVIVDWFTERLGR